jgi:hypothetical protein
VDPRKKLPTWTHKKNHSIETKDTLISIPLMSSQAYIKKATGIDAKRSNKTPNVLFIKISRIEC